MTGAQKAQPFGHPLDGRVRRRLGRGAHHLAQLGSSPLAECKRTSHFSGPCFFGSANRSYRNHNSLRNHKLVTGFFRLEDRNLRHKANRIRCRTRRAGGEVACVWHLLRVDERHRKDGFSDE